MAANKYTGFGKFILPALLLTCQPVAATDTHRSVASPAVAIIIDDLGNRYNQDLRAIKLPGQVTYAFLPYTPHASELAQLAHDSNKEIMLHAPMQDMEGRPLGPGALTLDMTEHEFKQSLRNSIASIPYVRGINNHMGSLLTRHPGHMGWLMELLAEDGQSLYFVDSRTTHHTVAQQIAEEKGIPHLRRHVFLDTIAHDPAYVRAQFRALLRQAKTEGSAVAIGHPYPATLDVLQNELQQLKYKNIRLVSVSELLLQQRRPTWHASSSHSHRVVKNSKPSR